MIRQHHLTTADYEGENERLNAILEHFPDDKVVLVQGPRGLLPVPVPKELRRREAHAAAKQAYLDRWN
jgi:hypothetical protein